MPFAPSPDTFGRPWSHEIISDQAGPALVNFRASNAGTVHDLGNLIQVVSSALSILARQSSAECNQSHNPVLSSARASLERAGALVRQSLGAQGGRVAMSEPVDLAKCLNDQHATLQSVCGPFISLSIQSGAQLPPLFCNRLELENALLNLVINARDALPKGGTISIVAAKSGTSDAPGLLLCVSDDGLGMSPETMEHALDPFFTTKGHEGNGVGLSMVARFAREAGGSVHLESAIAVGTVVTLLFPARTTERLDKDHLQATDTNSSKPTFALRRYDTAGDPAEGRASLGHAREADL